MRTASWKNATPEQLNLWRYVSSLLVGVQTITPLYYHGVIAGSEFLTYDVKKLYLALELCFSYGSGVAFTASGLITFYNEANAISGYLQNDAPVWDTTAAAIKYTINAAKENNCYFSRITAVATTYAYIKFNGYKITIP
jgi:hypothetical protein